MSGRYPGEGYRDGDDQRDVWSSDAPLPGEQYQDPYGGRGLPPHASGANRVPPGAQYPSGPRQGQHPADRDPRRGGPSRREAPGDWDPRETGDPRGRGRDRRDAGGDRDLRGDRDPRGTGPYPRDPRDSGGLRGGQGAGGYPRDPRGSGGYPVTGARYEDDRYDAARFEETRSRDPRRDDRYRDARHGDNRYPEEGADWEGDGILPGFDRRERGYPGRGAGRDYREDTHGDDRYAEGDGPEREGRSGNRNGRGRKRGARRLAPWIALAVLLLILIPVAGGGLYAYHYLQAKNHPPDYVGAGTGPQVTVQVASGDTATSLGLKLQGLGVVESQRAFILAGEHSTSTAGLEAGYFQMNVHMQASLAYAYLINPKNRVQSAVTIPEGKRVAQIIATLATEMKVPVSQFESIVDNPSQLGLPSYATKTIPGFKGIGYKVEGYLFPATYVIEPHETPLQVLQAMVTKYNQESVANNLAAAASASHLTVQQLLIEASLVQSEAGSASDMPKVARVISNRLQADMALQFDSVLEYGLDKFAVNIQNSWSSIPGPYNDFQHKGLPPGPISNPGLAAINAVLHPASGNWLYFLAYPNGKSQFSATPLPGQA